MLRFLFSFFVCFIFSAASFGQENNQARYAYNADASRKNEGAGYETLTLNDCLRFALKNQPAINQAYIDAAIACTNNTIALSAWLPQVNGAANLQHYFQLRTTFFNQNGTLSPVKSGVINNSAPQLNATQTLFNSDVLLALRGSKLNTQGARLATAAAKINTVSSVSKAFYDLLLSLQQISVYKEDTARLHKNQSDAYHRYVSGVADKVDYKQATISLNNSLSRLQSAANTVQSKYASLKQAMGYSSDVVFDVNFDTAKLMQEIYADTLTTLRFENRIEYQLLQTAKRIQQETTKYYRLSLLPSLSGYYNYIHEYQNNNFSDLYNHGYPYSYAGLQLNIPIFSGLRRVENIRKSKLQEQRTDWDEINLKLAIYSEYKQALSNYKSNLYYLHAQGENVQMAREVYNIVKLQYSEGVKPYVDVVVAETDLQASEINYLNALFSLLTSKIDLEAALGNISPDI